MQPEENAARGKCSQRKMQSEENAVRGKCSQRKMQSEEKCGVTEMQSEEYEGREEGLILRYIQTFVLLGDAS
jgi:hypothetical protein